jgi:hypothetical protein
MRAKMRKARKGAHVSDDVFLEIETSLGQALDHARGRRSDLRTTRIELPPEPRRMTE